MKDKYTKQDRILLIIPLCILLYTFYLSLSVITPFFISFLLAYLANPIVTKIQSRMLPRGLLSFLIVLCFLFILVWVIFFLLPVFIEQAALILESLSKVLPELYRKSLIFMGFLDKKYQNLQNIRDKLPINDINLEAFVEKILEAIFKYMASLAKNILISGYGIIEFLSFFLIVPLATFYILKDWQLLSKSFRSVVPIRLLALFDKITVRIHDIIVGYITAQLLIALFLSFFYYLGLRVVGINNALFIGMFSGIISFIPYIGFALGLIISIVASFLQSYDINYILPILALFFIGLALESQIISPKLMSDNVGMHPVLVIFSLILGGVVMGPAGMIIAVPIFAVISVFLQIVVNMYRSSDFYLS